MLMPRSKMLVTEVYNKNVELENFELNNLFVNFSPISQWRWSDKTHFIA